MLKEDQNGYILVTSLLLLLVLTVVGMIAMGSSTIENLLSGNIRLRERNIAKADGAADISAAVIQRTVREQDNQCFSGIILDPNLSEELRTMSFDPDANTDAAPDVQVTVDDQPVNVDIDKMDSKWMGGTAIEFASGYEGVGKSGATGFYAFYRINASSPDLINSQAAVGTVYRYVPK